MDAIRISASGTIASNVSSISILIINEVFALAC